MTDNEPHPIATVHKYEVGVTTQLDQDQKERLAGFLRSLAEERNVMARGYHGRRTPTVSGGAVIGYTGTHKFYDLAPATLRGLRTETEVREDRVVGLFGGDLA